MANDTSKQDIIDDLTIGNVILCLHCNTKTYAHIIANYIRNWDYELICGSYEWNLYLCPVCKEVTLEQKSECSEDIQHDHNGDSYVEPKISILYPSNPINSLPEPHKDLPEELINDYEEARTIAHLSPRGAAALLRLLLQKFCKHLGATGKNINNDIAYLTAQGLPNELQKAFDIVRIIGNEAVHPGFIDLKDDIVTVKKLFSLINLSVDYLITKPIEIDDLYSNLPPTKIVEIEKRDRKI